MTELLAKPCNDVLPQASAWILLLALHLLCQLRDPCSRCFSARGAVSVTLSTAASTHSLTAAAHAVQATRPTNLFILYERANVVLLHQAMHSR